MKVFERKYFKKYDGEDEWKEITYDEALTTLLGTYRDNDMTRDMLETANYIPCRYSTVEVKEVTEHGLIVLMAGLQNMLPMGNEYDDEGNRIN